MLSKKVDQITPSFTIGISSKVSLLRKNGETIIDLSIGEPDFTTPLAGKSKALEAIHQNMTKYDLVPGLLPLREAICQKLQMENHVAYLPAEIVASSGAKNAITNALMAVLDPGDEVIVPSPYWTSYPEMIKLCHGIPVIINTDKKNDYKLKAEQLEAMVTSKTKLLLINNPSNPTGSVYSKDELVPLVNFCIKNNILILADEIYEKIHFDETFTSIPSISNEAKNMTILVNGFSKSAAMTGWRLGYTASNAKIAASISTIQGHLTSHPSTIAQWAGLGALESGDEEMQHMVKIYKDRRDCLLPLLNGLPNVDYVYPQGAFYLFLDLSHYKYAFTNEASFSIAFCDQFLSEYKVAVVPGIAFGNDDCIRISYATKIEWVIDGLDKLKNFLSTLEIEQQTT